MDEIDYVAQGYRITSRKYGMISRIDNPNWIEFFKKEQPNWFDKAGNFKGITKLQAADHYRRVYSKDTLELGRKALTLKIPNSGDLL